MIGVAFSALLRSKALSASPSWSESAGIVVTDYQTAAITCLHQERRCAFRRWRLGMALDGGADSVLGPARDP